jgi:hypothetical protein
MSTPEATAPARSKAESGVAGRIAGLLPAYTARIGTPGNMLALRPFINLVWLCTDSAGYGVYPIKHEYAEA